ncbi:MAG: hypothetical protein LBJ02_04445 [Bifidobacteriaceae bacterium]|nr:hypothetical protein [Bifidobacteriaceae bacterium]
MTHRTVDGLRLTVWMMVTVLFGGLLMAVVSGAAWAYAADPVSEGEPVTITVDEVKDLDGSGIEHG